MAVKLDVKFNWLIDKYSLQTQIDDAIKSSGKRFGNVGRNFFKDYPFKDLGNRVRQDISSINKLGEVFERTFTRLKAMNEKGELAGYIGTKFKKTGRQRKKLYGYQLFQLAEEQTRDELLQEKLLKDAETKGWLDNAKFDDTLYKKQLTEAQERWKNRVVPYGKGISKQISNITDKYKKSDAITDKLGSLLEKSIISSSHQNSKKLDEETKQKAKLDAEEAKREYDRISEQSKEDAKLYNEQQKKLREDKKKEEKFRKDALNAFFMRWGKLGIAGLVAGQVIRIASKIAHLIYNTSMQGLDWRRTISGGASGGSWFGQDIAAYQRAGLGANQIQGFKRGLQSYLGSVKLGMGNAAPLMMLGLNALDNPDAMEKQIERSLRRFPKDVSLALAQQMGLDYGMWEAIYNGRLDRSKSAYSEEGMQKWAYVADKLNDLLTSLKVFGFEKAAGVMYGGLHPKDALSNASFIDRLLMGNPLTFTTGYAHAAQNVTINVNANTQDGYQQGQEIGRGCRDAFMQYRES